MPSNRTIDALLGTAWAWDDDDDEHEAHAGLTVLEHERQSGPKSGPKSDPSGR